MNLRRILFAVSLTISALCLAVGFGSVGQWIGALLAFLSGPAWLLARKFPKSGLPLICLLFSVCLAVIGNLDGCPPVFMICSSGFALATWDLLLLDNEMGSKPPEEQARRFENRHLQTLALALGAGLAAAVLGQGIRIQIPFA